MLTATLAGCLPIDDGVLLCTGWSPTTHRPHTSPLVLTMTLEPELGRGPSPPPALKVV